MRTVPGSEIVRSTELRRREYKKKERKRKKVRKKEVKNRRKMGRGRAAEPIISTNSSHALHFRVSFPPLSLSWNRLLNNRIAFPSSRRVVIRYYWLIIQIFSAVICRYEMMRLCWLENPLMRPTFAEITKRFQYYLREYKVLSWVFLCLIH